MIALTAYQTSMMNQDCMLEGIEHLIGETDSRMRRLSGEIDPSFADLIKVVEGENYLLQHKLCILDKQLENSEKRGRILRRILRQSREYTAASKPYLVKHLEIKKEGKTSKQEFLLIAVYLVFKKFCLNVLLVWVNQEPRNFSSQEMSRFSQKKSIFSSLFPFWQSRYF